MLSKEAIDDLKIDCSFEQIQTIENSLISIEKWDIVSQKDVRNYIDNWLFAKYKVHA